MDPFDEKSGRQVTWLEILSTFIIVAFILGSFAVVSQFAGSAQNGQHPLLTGSEAVANGPPTIAPWADSAEEDDRERRAVGWR